MKPILATSFIVILFFGVLFRLLCGIFIIQPLGSIPEGVTIVYWRNGIDLPFIASPDGLIEKSGQGVSLFARGMMLAKYSEPIKKNEILRLGYSETIFTWSKNKFFCK